MAKVTISIDENACIEIMRRYQFESQSEAVNFALHALVAEPLNLQDARRLRGSGWDGDLNAMRSTKTAFVEHLLDIPNAGEDDDFSRK